MYISRLTPPPTTLQHSTYAVQGRHREAIDGWERTVAIQREGENLGESYWETQEAMHCLDYALHCSGQNKKTMSLMRRGF
jgi:hypothetical protein